MPKPYALRLRRWRDDRGRTWAECHLMERSRATGRVDAAPGTVAASEGLGDEQGEGVTPWA